MKSLIIGLTLILSFQSMAVTPIKAGEKAPHSGFIFSKEEEQKIRKIRMENLTLKDLTIKQDELIIIQSKRIVILERQVDNNRIGTLGKVLYFVGGVLATSAAIYGASKLAGIK